jgi:hypothetical protein
VARLGRQCATGATQRQRDRSLVVLVRFALPDFPGELFKVARTLTEALGIVARQFLSMRAKEIIFSPDAASAVNSAGRDGPELLGSG